MLHQSTGNMPQQNNLASFSQNLKEVDSALWNMIAEQNSRDDIKGIIRISAEKENLVSVMADATIEKLTSGVFASFRISGLDEKSMINSLSHHYSPHAVISRMASVPTPGPSGKSNDCEEKRIRRSLVTMYLEVAANLADTLPPASLAIKTGLPEVFCSQLKHTTLTQIKRFGWALADHVYFELRFPENILDMLEHNPSNEVFEQKINFCLSDGLID